MSLIEKIASPEELVVSVFVLAVFSRLVAVTVAPLIAFPFVSLT